MHPVIYVIHGLFSVYMGFAMQSRGSFFTEKRKRASAFFVICWGLGCFSLALFNREWVSAFLVVVLYLVCSGIGGIVARAAIRASISDSFTSATASPSTPQPSQQRKKGHARLFITCLIISLFVLITVASIYALFDLDPNGYYDSGYSVGYEEGHTAGYAEGRQIGINIGKASGYRDGVSDGFIQGQIEYLVSQNSLTKAKTLADENDMRYYFVDCLVSHGIDPANW